MKTALAAALIAVGLASSALAGGRLQVYSDAPGELVRHTIDTAMERQYFHSDGSFGFALAHVSVTVDGRRVMAYALAPSETPTGTPLNRKQSAALMLKTHRHFGIFDTKKDALKFVEFLNEPRGPNE
jgi:hypothetical protein